MFKIIFILYISSFTMFQRISLTSGEVFRELPCKNLQPQADFERNKFLGFWEEYLRAPREFEGGSNAKCTIIHYAMLEGNKKNTTRAWVDKSNNKKYIFYGIATLDNAGRGMTPDGFNYTIVHTDYAGYAILYACHELKSKRADFVWLLFRDSDQYIRKKDTALEHLTEYGLDYPELQLIEHKDCPEDWSDAIVVEDSSTKS